MPARFPMGFVTPCQHVELGAATTRWPAYVTTSGGQLRVEVTDLPTGVIVGSITHTAVFFGDGDAAPRPRPENPLAPANATHEVSVGQDDPATVQLPAGRYWVASARGGRTTLVGCGNVRVSDVQPASPDPTEAFGLDESPR